MAHEGLKFIVGISVIVVIMTLFSVATTQDMQRNDDAQRTHWNTSDSVSRLTEYSKSYRCLVVDKTDTDGNYSVLLKRTTPTPEVQKWFNCSEPQYKGYAVGGTYDVAGSNPGPVSNGICCPSIIILSLPLAAVIPVVYLKRKKGSLRRAN